MPKHIKPPIEPMRKIGISDLSTKPTNYYNNEQHFWLDIAIYSLNNYRNAHFRKLYTVKKDIGESVHWQLLAQKAKPCQTPVEITYIFHWGNNRIHDLDNYVATAKMVQDALTPSTDKKPYGVGIIPDDDTRYITKLTFLGGEKKRQGVELIIKNKE